MNSAKTVKVRKNKKGDYYLDIKELAEKLGLDHTKVAYYRLKMNKDKSAILYLYDKNKKKIKLKQEEP